MYDWRKMTAEQRREALEHRKQRCFPWHGPPHPVTDLKVFHVSAACYEHCPFIGKSPKRMAECEAELLEFLKSYTEEVFAWCVLPNHYHVLAKTKDMKRLAREMRNFHGSLSFRWNGEDRTRGRKVWHRCSDRAMRSDGHFWSAMNYIHHNPVHHGYVRRWEDWPYSSVAVFLEKVGKDKAAEIWRNYPVLDSGKGWDDPDL